MAIKTLEELLDELLANRMEAADARRFVELVDASGGRQELERMLDEIFGGREMEVEPDAARQQLVKAMLMEKIRVGAGDGAVRAGAVEADEYADAAGAREVTPVRRLGVRGLRWAAAAAVVVLAAGGWWLYGRRPAPAVASRAERYHNDVAPGGGHAVLKLADGRQIGLDAGVRGLLAQEGGNRLVARGGQLIDERGAGATGGEGGGVGAAGSGRAALTGLEYNTVTTPAASQYHLTLADGTQVWLDAMSSIRFPAAFGKGARAVEISGQAYLEVAKDEQHPFIVKAGPETVTVLGTAFNICAYGDEPVVRTTLAQGAVKVAAGGAELVLKPGQESQVDKSGVLSRGADADLAATLAWKNGLFAYEGADIATIMRQLARWYDVTIDYRDRVTETFVAQIPRDVPLSKALTLLEGTGQVHFIIQGKRVTVIR